VQKSRQLAAKTLKYRQGAIKDMKWVQLDREEEKSQAREWEKEAKRGCKITDKGADKDKQGAEEQTGNED